MTTKIKLLSYNIHKGFSLKNQYVLKEIKEAIDLTHADIVCLQEVVGNNKHGQKQNKHWISTPQFEFLADTTWSHYSYGKNAIKENKDHGNALLSKFPIESWKNIDVSSSALEKRGLLYTKILLPKSSKHIHLFSVHLSLLGKDRKAQLKVLQKSINELCKLNEPIIIAGDFNDWNQALNKIMHFELGFKEAFMELTGDNPKTFPSAMPLLKLDRVYYKNAAVSALALSGKPWMNLSDHLALLVELEF